MLLQCDADDVLIHQDDLCCLFPNTLRRACSECCFSKACVDMLYRFAHSFVEDTKASTACILLQDAQDLLEELIEGEDDNL